MVIQKLIEENIFYKKFLMKIFNCDEKKLNKLFEIFNKAISLFGESRIDEVISDTVEYFNCEVDVSKIEKYMIYFSFCAAIEEVTIIEDLSSKLVDKLVDHDSQVHFVPEDFNDFEIKERQKNELANKFNKFLELKAELERNK